MLGDVCYAMYLQLLKKKETLLNPNNESSERVSAGNRVPGAGSHAHPVKSSCFVVE